MSEAGRCVRLNSDPTSKDKVLRWITGNRDTRLSAFYSVDTNPNSTALICLHQPWDFMLEVVQCGVVDGHGEYLSWTYA